MVFWGLEVGGGGGGCMEKGGGANDNSYFPHLYGMSRRCYKRLVAGLYSDIAVWIRRCTETLT